MLMVDFFSNLSCYKCLCNNTSKYLKIMLMRHGAGPYLGLYEIGKSSSIIIFIIISYLFNRTFYDLFVTVFRIYLLGFL